MPEKNLRNFFDFIGVRGRGARAARLVAVLRRSPPPPPAVLPPLLVGPRVRLQAETEQGSVVFETEKDVRIFAGGIKALFAVDDDKIFQPPPGLFDPTIQLPPPIARQLKSVARAGATQLQVSPALGLTPDMLIGVGGQQYRVKEVKGDLVTIEPQLKAEAAENSEVTQVRQFAPFGTNPKPLPAPHDWQEHVLYIADDDLLSVEAAAEITLRPSKLAEIAQWSYWSKKDDVLQWLPLEHTLNSAHEPVLLKPAGAIEKCEVNGQKLRVLRGVGSPEVEPVRNIQARVTSRADKARPIVFEGVANIAPIPSTTDFFPLGREPRLFDSFYIGCAEAFSKRQAKVTLDFELPTPTLGPLVVAPEATGIVTLFGVGKDGLLYKVRVDRRQKQIIEWDAIKRPEDPPGKDVRARIIQLAQDVMPTLLDTGTQRLIAVASRSPATGKAEEVWIWDDTARKWHGLGTPKENTGAETAAIALARDIAAGHQVFAVRAGRLLKHAALQPDTDWADVTPQVAGVPLVVTTVTAVGPSLASFDLLAADSAGDFHLLSGGVWRKLENSPEPNRKPDTNPLALWLGQKLLIVITTSDVGRELVAIRHDLSSGTPPPPDIMPLPLQPQSVECGLSFVPPNGGEIPTLVFLVGQANSKRDLALWRPFDWPEAVVIDAPWSDRKLESGVAVIPDPADSLTPTLVAIPGKDADVLLAELQMEPVSLAPADLVDAAVLDAVEPTAELVRIIDGTSTASFYELSRVVDFGGGRAAYALATDFRGDPANATSRLFKLLDPTRYSGSRGNTARKLTLDANDATAPTRGKAVTIGTEIYRITSNPAGRIVNVNADLPNTASFEYRYVEELSAANAPFNTTIRPLLALASFSSTARQRIQAKPRILVPRADPSLMPLASDPTSAWALLTKFWTTRPALQQGQYKILVPPSAFDPAHSQWKDYAVPANPALAWEYWNGKTWWKLDGVDDGTDHLRRSSQITFTVPSDIQPTDVVGRTNHWVRARLIGGDYGHESFTLKTGPTVQGVTPQTVERNTDTVRPPRVVSLTISYEGSFSYPAHIITRDNLAWRDQSDANRSRTAVVELFQSFKKALSELRPKSKQQKSPERCCEDAPADPSASDESEDCSCDEDAPPGEGASDSSYTVKALYLGTDVALKNGSVRIFWDAAELSTEPELGVESLREGQFDRLLADDETRGLTEPGVLSLAPPQEPSLTELFGQPCYWLRIFPAKGGDWKPVINGVFLNAVWAQAAETQDLEILGSSDGAPNQKVFLARPPVLDDSLDQGARSAVADTLELRVREPLTEDEMADLRRADPSIVRDDIPSAPGNWVRWTRVIDPLDCGPAERVYALDETTGEIAFGDARHGVVPPRGRDNIAAITYRRGGGKAGNAVVAGSTLQLVSPLPGVDVVVAAVTGAGGADPATPEETLRHAPGRLWDRDRAIAPRDLERLALAYAPNVAQARCIAAERSTRVVVVLAGDEPLPSRSMRRELQRYLGDRAGPLLRDRRLSVEAPETRLLDLEIHLTVESLGRSGSIEEQAREAIADLLHWNSGGFDRPGWPLGVVPGKDDVAGKLVGIPGVLGIGEIDFFDAADAEKKTPFPVRVSENTLVRLAPDGVHITFGEEARA
ncbi:MULTISPECIES: baseplate J/gp47 family protein [unclassified Bradyrhizobium]|uniref:baseplate J/gp47 family protein n=1 Tax=unclassified Bradyrhizobium TaxID=2631580 RepID=UPI002FF1E98B